MCARECLHFGAGDFRCLEKTGFLLLDKEGDRIYKATLPNHSVFTE